MSESHLGDDNMANATRVQYADLPDIPTAFAEYLLGEMLGEEHLDAGEGYIFFNGHDRLKEVAGHFYRDFEASFADMREALDWIKSLPAGRYHIRIDITEANTIPNETPNLMQRERFGTVSRINGDMRETLPIEVPYKLAQYILWTHYPGAELLEGEVPFTGQVNLDEYALVFGATEFDKANAEAWLEMMPRANFRMHIDIIDAIKEREQRYLGVLLTLEYVDCDCVVNYIKPSPGADKIKTGLEIVCHDCYAVWDDCPNSRVTEVMAAGLPFDEHRVEYGS